MALAEGMLIFMIAIIGRQIAQTGLLAGPLPLVGVALGAAIIAIALSPDVSAADTVSVEEAHAIGVQAYVYLYSLVTMDLTRRQLINTEHVQALHAPMNAVRERPGLSGGDDARGRAPELRHALLQRVARPYAGDR